MTSTEPAPPASVEFEGVCPILRVRSLAESIAYYVDVLGFAVDWEGPGVIASVSRGRCCIFLSEGDQGNPGSWVWVGVGDVDALHEEYRARGARIRQAPANFPWAAEMQVADPDGNVLRMGSEPKEDQPYGPWRDMHGILWVMQPDGRWVRAGVGKVKSA
jgi:catechol 2,3-dioxygenase-like lactoylglutathione lyase family enzyme